MQSYTFDFLLNAYLTERSKAIDLSQLTIPNLHESSNALSSLEKIYQATEQSSSPNTNLTPNGIKENDDIVLSKDNHESSQISITVCDEQKNEKRQFSCNRLLLIREMRYFADYLKDEPDQAEEVDISVHCDINIFQWLMSFVNRSLSGEIPQLEPSIAISILVSSDFLKMDKLVIETMKYIHEHIKEILTMNCNLSCISDALFHKLAKYFSNPYEIEQLHDKRNRIRGKLFECHLIELLTNTKIIRCQFCQTIMTIEQMEFIPCLIDRFILKSNGKLSFQHKLDTKFVINDWIRDIHIREGSSFRNTFWIVWLVTHGDQCVRCDTYFRFIDFSTCSYHSLSSITDGKHDCCSQSISPFDIFQVNILSDGCQQREHICQTQNQFSDIYENLDKEELIKHQPALQLSLHYTNSTNLTTTKVLEQSIYGSINTDVKKAALRARWAPSLDAHPYGAEIKYAWDATKSTRWNQDAQREDEHRRFDEMLRHVQSIQHATKSVANRTLKESNFASFIPSGGIYCRIENEWRARQSTPVNNNSNNVNMNKNRQRTALK
ncbi:unnamed protein product [Adineta ricciae]|uniref:SANT and BTB domain-containing protein n=1 Tax=Adineta ricciae TaxID=249248 RepID=A0A813UIJ9_ADIRI|nr:unnamed protein product [Adineta ricciae]CAF1628786.1 unnamed protein product [Adineta ricciae]